MPNKRLYLWWYKRFVILFIVNKSLRGMTRCELAFLFPKINIEDEE